MTEELRVYALSTVSRIGLISGGFLVSAGLVALIVVLILRYRAEVADTDTRMRAAGHVPPEDASEVTAVIAPVRDVESGPGYYNLLRHTARPTTTAGGKHRQRSGCVTVADLQAREGVPA